ncbi:hypothetical protein P4S95_09375 [Aneurinibacillus aneurinilyticus]|uniref:hypothetical protein n=1 Tax=Aneurinibacillus aneurinilyticus TaxID=1391 RepID=UPI002E1D97F3|nr:hypothetical protein [Aneurinibacillus aneurinilyticus]
MDILSTIGYAIASYIVVYTILTIIVAGLIISFFIYAFRQWRKGQKEYEQVAAENRARREEIQHRLHLKSSEMALNREQQDEIFKHIQKQKNKRMYR